MAAGVLFATPSSLAKLAHEVLYEGCTGMSEEFLGGAFFDDCSLPQSS